MPPLPRPSFLLADVFKMFISCKQLGSGSLRGFAMGPWSLSQALVMATVGGGGGCYCFESCVLSLIYSTERKKTSKYMLDGYWSFEILWRFRERCKHWLSHLSSQNVWSVRSPNRALKMPSLPPKASRLPSNTSHWTLRAVPSLEAVSLVGFVCNPGFFVLAISDFRRFGDGKKSTVTNLRRLIPQQYLKACITSRRMEGCMTWCVHALLPIPSMRLLKQRAALLQDVLRITWSVHKEQLYENCSNSLETYTNVAWIRKINFFICNTFKVYHNNR